MLGTLLGEYRDAIMEKNAFGTCFNYFVNQEPIKVNCDAKEATGAIFIIISVGVTVTGAFALIRGYRGDWDSKVKSEDIVGPGKKSIDDDKENQS